jgi:hypothetical protein
MQTVDRENYSCRRGVDKMTEDEKLLGGSLD